MMPIYTNDPYDDDFIHYHLPLNSSVGVGPKVTESIDKATKEWLDEHPEATTTIEDGAVTTRKIADRAVTPSKLSEPLGEASIADGAVTSSKLANGSVRSTAIEDGSVTTPKLADQAVTTAKLEDLAVTTAKLANSSVTSDKIADDAVGASELSVDAIDSLPTMSTVGRGVAKVGAGLKVVNDAIELDSDGDITTAVQAWMDAHPEATTTVDDGSIDIKKLSYTLLDQLTTNQNDFFETNLLEFDFSQLPKTMQGMTFELDNKQQIHIYGTPTTVNIRNTFKDIDLPAGRYGYGNVNQISHVSFQARKIVNGADAGFVDGTSGTGSIGYFTLTERTTVRIRIAVSGSDNIDGYAQPILMRTDGSVPAFYIEPIQMRARIHNQMFDYIGTILSGTDLSAFTNVGIWNLNAGTYVNSPDDSVDMYGLLFVMQRNNLLYQILLNCNGSNIDAIGIYYRRSGNNGSTWGPWYKSKSMHEMRFKGTLAGNSDFDDMTTGGIWTIVTGGSYDNGPDFSTQSGGTLVVYGREDENAQQTYQVVFAYFDGKVYMRRRTGNPGSYVWGSWNVIGDKSLPFVANIISYPDPIPDGSTAVVGTKVKVMSYNVAQFDNDTTTDISDAQLVRMKQMLMSEDCDVLGFQECPGVVDTNGSSAKGVNANLFYPNYPYTYIQDVSIISRTPLSDRSVGTLTSGRKWSHAIVSVGGKNVSVYCVHPYPGTEEARVSLRYQDWSEFANIINADQSDYIVCLGDFNTNSMVNGELDVFESTFAGWIMANGGYIGWYETTGRYSPNIPTDNILVNQNVAMTCMRPLTEWYDLLYSDHVPLVATLVLKDI